MRAFSIWLLVLIATEAVALANQNFDLVNRTGSDIAQVYVTRHNTKDSWGDDVMTSDILYDGQTVHINFPSSGGWRFWDLKVVYRNGDSATWMDGFNLLRIYRITLTTLEDGTTNAHYDYTED